MAVYNSAFSMANETLNSDYHSPKTVDELTQSNVEAIAALEHAAMSQRSRLDRFVDSVTKFCGHIAFVYIHIILFSGWVVINSLALHRLRFDPYPFNFLTLAVSLEAIFLSAFILISQNRTAHIDERRSQLHLQVALLSEQQNTKMLQMLEAIGRHVGAEICDDPDIAVLEAGTRPEVLIEQIESARKNDKR